MYVMIYYEVICLCAFILRTDSRRQKFLTTDVEELIDRY